MREEGGREKRMLGDEGGELQSGCNVCKKSKEGKKKVLVALTSLTHDTSETELDEIHVNAHIKCSLSLTFFMRALSCSMKCQF